MTAVQSAETPIRRRRRRVRLRTQVRAMLLVLGPGLVSGFADNDSGGITTYSLAGAQFGYGLVWSLFVTMLALMVTQEVGARLGLATGQGLGGLIRERFGVRWTALAVLTMLVANIGTIIAEFAGIAAALSLFGVPPWQSSVLSSAFVVILLVVGSFAGVQLAFLAAGLGVSVAYAASAWLAGPDWSHAVSSLVVPEVQWRGAYLLTLVGVVGTTITPWGQAFIQSYVADKGLGPRDLTYSRLDIILGSFLTNLVAWFIVIACAATIWANGLVINDAADAARALGPLAGPSATMLFAAGLLAASLLGLGTVPLTTAYFACEAFGWESGVHMRLRQAPVFYGLLIFFIVLSAIFVAIPGLPLIQTIFLSQVLDGLLLPIVLIFVMLVSRQAKLGRLRSGRLLETLGWVVTVAVSVMALAYLLGPLIGLG